MQYFQNFCFAFLRPSTFFNRATVMSRELVWHLTTEGATLSDVVVYMTRHTIANPQFGPPPFVLLHTLFLLPQCILFEQLGRFPVEIQPQIPVSQVELPLCCSDEGSACDTHVGGMLWSSCGGQGCSKGGAPGACWWSRTRTGWLTWRPAPMSTSSQVVWDAGLCSAYMAGIRRLCTAIVKRPRLT